MPHFQTLGRDAQAALDLRPNLPDDVRAVLMRAVLADADMQRYQFLRERFYSKDYQLDGTYVPHFPNGVLQRAKTLDQSVDNAMKERTEKRGY